ncbi:tetratricopeptide repeat protein [Maribellus sp. CM-23]|uniref:tetratricopeptide repeat protein n=1 Tax=Maribellus sp. CM-23 TaxID=2781026 RepID=UPI001F213747|nr:tetratricopeptide repeat protein [Maribellus sp. CM-23]MCE4564592.1 tetratricopeptide repeat protein [Maribellus sp. CM-23]
MKEKPSREKTIAVLPFVNMSGSEEMEYFSDGITEEIINALARISQLKVTSRTSSFFFKNKNIPIGQIARELNVTTILEGSVRLAANTIRITAQLIHAEEDFHFWSESWDRMLDNIFEIQDEISLLIADKLREQYGHLDIQDHLIETKTANIEAYEYFLKGRYHFNKWNPEDAGKAIDFYEMAIKLDPIHTDSYVGLADAYSFFAVTELMPAEEAWQKSRENMDKAYALNPGNAGVHYLLANYSFFYEANFQEALKHGLKSIELKHNYPEAQQFISLLYLISGDTAKAKEYLEVAHSIDPLSQETLFYRAYYQYRAENFSEALSLFDEALKNNPQNIPAYIVRSYCLLKLGQYNETISFLENMPNEIVVHDERLGILNLAYILKKDTVKSEEYFNKLYEAAQNPKSFQAHSYLYLAYANLNETDKAFNWLKETIKLKSSVLLLNYTDPLANSLKDYPRYGEYKNRLYGHQPVIASTANAKAPLLDAATVEAFSNKLTKFVTEEQPFLIPNLSLRLLADQVEIHPNKLSWLLNERIEKNFNEFINYYRIEYFKQLAIDPKNSHISLIGLAYESGFNSKTVFNTYFKKETGMTPKEFLKQNA